MKLTQLRSRVIDSTEGLSKVLRTASPSVHALATSISPTGRMVVELPICSVNSESRFGAVADPPPSLRPAKRCDAFFSYSYPGRRASSSEIPDFASAHPIIGRPRPVSRHISSPGPTFPFIGRHRPQHSVALCSIRSHG